MNRARVRYTRVIAVDLIIYDEFAEPDYEEVEQRLTGEGDLSLCLACARNYAGDRFDGEDVRIRFTPQFDMFEDEDEES